MITLSGVRKEDIQGTLNRYGSDYLASGRNPAAVKSISGKDSDGDSFSNQAELEKGTNPGDPESNPSACNEREVFSGALKIAAP